MARIRRMFLLFVEGPTEAITLKEKDLQKRYIPAETHWSAITPKEIMQELEEYKT